MNKDDRDRFIVDAMMYLMSEYQSRDTKGRLMSAGAGLLYGLDQKPVLEDDQGALPCTQCHLYKNRGSQHEMYKYCPMCGRSLV